MSSQELSPPPPLCPERKQLVEDIRQAMNHVIVLNSREMQAVIVGQFASLPSIKSELIESRKLKDTLLDTYYSHVRDHGC